MENLIEKKDIRKFVFAGKSIFTILNTLTSNRFTYKISKSDNDNVYFVSLLRGPNNLSDYSYIGIIRNNEFKHTKNSKVCQDATSFKAFSWFNNHINNLPENINVFHIGKCGRCGRTLTTPESIKRGLGPECAGLV